LLHPASLLAALQRGAGWSALARSAITILVAIVSGVPLAGVTAMTSARGTLRATGPCVVLSVLAVMAGVLHGVPPGSDR
jgi:hypothetical protein